MLTAEQKQNPYDNSPEHGSAVSETSCSDINTLLARTDLFMGADLDALAELLQDCSTREYQAGETILKADQLCSGIYLIIEGRCFAANADGEPVSDSQYESGQIIGLTPFARCMPVDNNIVAADTSRIMVIDETVMTEMVNSSHAVARNLTQALLQQLRIRQEQHTEQKISKPNRHRISYVDELTGLHNQRWLMRILPRYIMRSSTDQQPLSLLAAKIDDFDAFHADYGDYLTDFVLHGVAQTLVNKARPSDMIARLDEKRFILILPDTDMEGAQIAAQRLSDIIAQTQIVIPNECVLPPVTVSIGSTQLQAFVAADKLLEDACEALQHAQAGE